MTKQINLTRGLCAIVDDTDYEWLSQWKWRAVLKVCKYWIAVRCLPTSTGETQIRMHRLITDAPSEKVVDHINGNTLDNRRCNLRVCDQAKNVINRHKRRGTTSQYKGVSWDKIHRKWVASVKIDGKKIWLGRFSDEREAMLAYDRAAKQCHGEFARLNSPEI